MFFFNGDLYQQDLSSHDKVMESKVKCFSPLACWLMTSCSSPAQIQARSKRTRVADQSIHQSINHGLGVTQGSIERMILSWILITFEMIVTVESKCKDFTLGLLTQHISSCQCFGAKGERILCVPEHLLHTWHSFNLCLRYTCWCKPTLIFLNVPKKETCTIMLPLLFWGSFFVLFFSFLPTENTELAVFPHSVSHSWTLGDGSFLKCLKVCVHSEMFGTDTRLGSN